MVDTTGISANLNNAPS